MAPWKSRGLDGFSPRRRKTQQPPLALKHQSLCAGLFGTQTFKEVEDATEDRETIFFLGRAVNRGPLRLCPNRNCTPKGQGLRGQRRTRERHWLLAKGRSAERVH